MQTLPLPHQTKNKLTRWQTYLLLVVLGGMHASAFAVVPLPAWFLPFAQLSLFSIFTVQIYLAPCKRATFARSWVFSFSFFAVGVHWLYNSMHVYGHMPVVLALAAVALFAALLALLPALAALLFYTLRTRLQDSSGLSTPLLVALLWASCWTLGEWVRGTLFTGFPWLNIAYAHLDGPLGGWAPLVGAYGMAWLAAFAAAAITTLVIYRDLLPPLASSLSLGVGILLGLIGAGLSYIPWSENHGSPFIARLIQGNVPQTEKFDPDFMMQGIQHYYELASLPPKSADGKPDLIVLPETVIPMLQDRFDARFWDQWVALAQQMDTQLLLGVPLSQRSNQHQRYTNSVIAIDPQTRTEAILRAEIPAYHKQHLVPFGEFIPPGFAWFVEMMQIPLGNFQRGSLPQASFRLEDSELAPNICYEDVFGQEIRQAVLPSDQSAGANVLINVSNLAWFGSSWALYQHLQFSRLRAMETARPLLRSTNTGITAAIDAKGYVRAALAPQITGVLDIEVQGMRGLTPYVRWGDLPALLWLLLWLIPGLLPRHRQAA